MTTTYRFIFCLFLSLFLSLPLYACNEQQPKNQTSVATAPELVQWYLPKPLREVSGLALLDDHTVLAIQDEKAEIYRLDIDSGAVVGRYKLGKPTLKGDFEGLAVHNDRLYLVTSGGRLYTANLSAETTITDIESFDTGLKERCELEGLTHEGKTGLLWMVCKQVFDRPNDDTLMLFAWSIAAQALVPELTKTIPLVTSSTRYKLNPSGLAFSPDGARLLVIAARQSAYAWFSWLDEPRLLSVHKLPAQGKHRQAEGVSITGQGVLLIADEGKKKRGTLSRYATLLP